MVACSLRGVTPPLVNTGLEVSSVDKNTLASQQRGGEEKKTEFLSVQWPLCARS